MKEVKEIREKRMNKKRPFRERNDDVIMGKRSWYLHCFWKNKGSD